MSAERYFAFGFNSEDESRIQKKLITAFNNCGIRLNPDDETLFGIEKTIMPIGFKILVLCKVSATEINNQEEISESNYTKLTYNDKLSIPIQLKEVFESIEAMDENLKTFQYNIEYLYIPLVSSAENMEFSETWMENRPGVTEDEIMLAKLLTLLRYYIFKSHTKNTVSCEVLNLLDENKLILNFNNNKKYLDLLSSISDNLNENTLARLWKLIFSWGVFGVNDYDSKELNIPHYPNIEFYVDNVFKTSFTNMPRFCNNINNGNIFHKNKGVEGGINIYSLFNITPKYKLITTYYKCNELNDLTLNDVIGPLVARKNSSNPKNFTCLKYRHFKMDYSHSDTNTDDLLFNINGFNYINTLIKDMVPDLEIFKFKIKYQGRGQTTMGHLFKIDVYIRNDYYGRIITGDNMLNTNFKSITKFIMYDNKEKLNDISYDRNVVCADMLSPEKTGNQHGEYYPEKAEIKEHPAVDKYINAKLFSYQKRNITWLDNVERDIRNGKHKLKTKRLGIYNSIDNRNIKVSRSEILEYTINNNNFRTLSLDDGNNVILPPNIDNDIEISGGIIADEVGLGKTLTIISHLVNQYEQDKLDYLAGHFDCDNLIIIPSRLLNQWLFEIEKYVPSHLFNVIPIATINDIKKYSANKHLFESEQKTSIPATVDLKKGKFVFPANLSPDSKLLVSKLIDDLGDLVTKHQIISFPSLQEIKKLNLTTPSKKKIHLPKISRNPNKKMDIVIMSSNILANKNYYDYLASFEKNQIHSKYDYHMSDYLDILKMKWNRVIVDEAHERICMCADHHFGDFDERQIAYIIINILQSRYRWAMTATPFEKNFVNGLAYLSWFMTTTKKDLETTDIDYSLMMSNDLLSKMFYGRFYNFPYLVTEQDLINLQKLTLIRTTKKSVSAEIKIPIFTEEIVTMNLSQIERNIYNNAKTDMNYHSDRIRRLFHLCTNICISSADIENMGIDPTKPVTLEELNAAMVKNFSKQTQTICSELNGLIQELPLMDKKSELSIKIQKDLRVIEPMLDMPNSENNARNRHFVECLIANEENPNRTHYGLYNDNDRKAFKLLRKELYARLLECETYSESIISIAVDCLSTLDSQRPDWDEYRTIFIIDYLLGTFGSKSQKQRKHLEDNIAKMEREKVRLENQIKLFENNDFIKEKTSDPCSICWSDFTDDSKIAVTPCRHVFCGDCFDALGKNKASFPCPECRTDVNVKKTNITTMLDLLGKAPPTPVEEIKPEVKEVIHEWKEKCISKYGTKMAVLVEKLQELLTNDQYRVIIFSQYDMMLRLIGKTLNEFGIKNIYAKGNVRVVNKNIDTFKRDSTYRVIMLSSEHSNSGSNLTEASHIILVDVLNMDAVQTKQVEAQAIGRAVRLGQQKPVKVIRLITNDTVESVFYEKNKYDIMSVQ